MREQLGMHKPMAILAVLSGLISTISAAENGMSVTVSAGDFERQQTVVSFRLPTGMRSVATSNQLRDEKGRVYPLQVDKEGQAWFVVEQLGKGAKATYTLGVGPVESKGPGLKIQQEKKRLEILREQKPLLVYQTEPSDLPRPDIDPVYQRGGYIHPVATLTGKVVTDHYPPNHLHQDGIFFAWCKTEFQGRKPDFWNLKDKKGRVEFVALANVWDGPVHAGFTSSHRHMDLTSGKPIVALNETWAVRVYANPTKTSWVFDLTSTQTCAGPDGLKLPQYHYGQLGFRGNWAWNGKDACTFRTSEGETDRIKGNGTVGRWCDVWGNLEGADAGIAILGHPDNFRAPQPLRLHPDEPYISFSPQFSGPLEITPGKAYVTRFRFVVHDGKPDKAELERIWNDYAHPPEVVVK